jgi:endonuclease/exonuclease/phosphatase family metal-dependent hydrolase
MKILFLNAWKGRLAGPISTFIKQQVRDTDVFCFQEAHEPMQSLCHDLLADYNKVIANKTVSEVNDFCQATYARKNIDIVSSDTVFADQTDVGLAIDLQIKISGQNMHIVNVHGASRPSDKLDTPARIEFSSGLIERLKSKTGPRVIGGDFNAFPSTQSIRTFRESGYRDLIYDFDIRNTRNRFSWEKYPDDDEATRQYFSDYAFVSNGVIVKKFSVLGDEVSDHLPLSLELDYS